MKPQNVEHEVIFNKLLSSYNSLHDGNLNQNINILRNTYNNSSNRPLYSDRKILGPFLIFFRRVIRRFLRFYIEPICLQQTQFNQAATNLLSHINKKIDQLNQTESELITRIKKLEDILENKFTDKIEIKQK